ncbi:MAG TPA: MBL fold metallo-hydrolase [Myxococcota bacterium]|nr:MBL fold metallo-hydrolase [Myxococcota bacterium]
MTESWAARSAAAAAFLAVLASAGCGSREGTGAPPRLWAGAQWLDDWYAVERIDEASFALFEPRYAQHNVSYLLVGSERALLFDTGPGERDIRGVVGRLTDRPVVAAFSHTHYDHVGGHEGFDAVGSLDHPTIRARTDAAGRFTPTLAQHGALGRPSFRITEWWAADGEIDLGGRRLRALSIPGHTPESLGLFDPERRQLFTGDFLYPGDLFAFNPGADLAAYHESAERLLTLTANAPGLAIFGAHVPAADTSPRQTRADLARAEVALRALVEGKAGAGELAWFLVIPVRRFEFGGGLAILAPLLRGAARDAAR